MTTKVKKQPKEQPPTEDFGNQLVQTADSLVKGCSKVRLRFRWFSTQAKINDDVLGEMMGGVAKEVKEAVAASKRLMKSSHESLVSAKQAFKAIKDYAGSMTIPLILLKQASTDGEMDDDALRKDAGVRVIQKKDMAEFDDKMQYLKSLLATSVTKLQKALPSIKEEDKKRLDKVNKKLYNDADYPSDVTELIGVEYGFEVIGVDADWETLCPTIFERERSAARKKFEAVVETAAVGFADRFVKYVKQVVDQLGNRWRLNPKKDCEFVNITGPDGSVMAVNVKDSEIKTRLAHKDDPQAIPEGHVLCELRLAKAGKGRSTEVWMATPMKENKFYDELRPYETQERKKLYESTIENLKNELETFVNIGSMLGPYQGVVSDSVSKVKEMLTQGSNSLNIGEIADQLREGNFFRNQMKSTLEGVAHVVQGAMKDTVESRRSLSSKMPTFDDDDDD